MGVPSWQGTTRQDAAWLPSQISDLVLKIGSGDDEKVSENGLQKILSNQEGEKRQSAKAEKYEMELRASDVLDTLRRYKSGLKRDLYRVVEFLRRGISGRVSE